MSLRRGAVDIEALHALIDGLLPPERMAAVELYLAEHPEEQKRWSDYAAQRQELREALTMAPGEPIPQRLRLAPRSAREQARIGRRQTGVRRARRRADPDRSNDPDPDPSSSATTRSRGY
jgi:anti-sigma factor RsiW